MVGNLFVDDIQYDSLISGVALENLKPRDFASEKSLEKSEKIFLITTTYNQTMLTLLIASWKLRCGWLLTSLIRRGCKTITKL